MDNFTEEEWFSLDDITISENNETLYCISVDSPDKQFLIGNNISVPTHNTDEAKAEDELKGEASMILGSVARLGRAAGVHLIIATQRPDATIISGETKANLGVRINAGRTDSNASGMILGTGDGTRVKANPRGRLYMRIYGAGNHGQGFFAEQSWIDNYLESQGKNPDGSPISAKRSKLATVADISQFEDADLDTQSGVDNSSVIEKIREEESDDEFDELMGEDTAQDDDDTDWGFEEDSTPVEDKLGRPELNGTGAADMSRFDRPEENWDSDLDDLINENNE